ncbi:type II toxin-antitoxin system Phd/YefM family antitoxin [Reyranella sp.]|uniref:type II toxin-antitoxin system Phd/YefM family antitoxin n=1 Tax=Reyranella sp. TaxID=1929291 RepID=UPI0039C9C778
MFNLCEAKNQLSSLVDRAASGEEIIVAKHGRPLAKLVPRRPRGRGRASPRAPSR